MSRSISDSWNLSLIEETKKEIKAELDTIVEEAGCDQRQEYIDRRIRELESDVNELNYLRIYVLLINSLLLHEAFDHLSQSRVNQTVKYINDLLRATGVKPGNSTKAMLLAEIEIVRGQICRRLGKHWHAAWHQQIAMNVAGKNSPGGEGYQIYSMANRAFRLGYGRVAFKYFQLAESKGISEKLKNQSFINQVRVLRLTGQLEESENLANNIPEGISISYLEIELKWESICRKVQADGDLTEMLASIRKGKPHSEPYYQLECCLWIMAHQSRKLLERMPKLSQLKRQKKMRLGKLDYLFKCVSVLQRCYDYERPLNNRIEDLGESLANSDLIFNIDKQLLYWAGACRWLLRSKSYTLAQLAFAEYQSTCMRLCGDKYRDVLGVLSDISEQTFDDKNR